MLKILTFLCGAMFIPALLLSKITFILSKGHMTSIQLLELLHMDQLNEIHVIPTYLPTL